MRQTESAKQYTGVFVIIIILCVTATIYKPDYFDISTVYMILRQATALGILSMGQLLVVTAGGIDLSLDGNIRISLVVFMSFYTAYGGGWLWAGILIALLAGLGLGAVTGFIITKFNVAPFLITIFAGVVFDGVRRMFTGVSPMGVTPPGIAQFVKGEQTGQVPHTVYILAAAVIITYIAANKTVLGRKLTLAGSNPVAADFSGIRVRRLRFLTYIISGGTAVLASVIIAGYTGYVDQENMAGGIGFESLIAVVLGGNLLGGGKPTVIGTLGGAVATTMIINIAVLFGFQVQHQFLFKGIILLLVVFVSAYMDKHEFSLNKLKVFSLKGGQL